MTEKLFYKDAYTKEFTAKVLSCRACEKKRGYAVVLDKTAFFPEGGGQYADVGTLSGIKVKDVQEKDGEIFHYTEEPLKEGETISGKIDWEIRFSRMQQHTAEHILSGLVHERYGYDNVGFHLNDDFCTMDFNGFISGEEMKDIETKANRAVYENKRIEVLYPSEEELKSLIYRSKIEIEGQVRIVKIPGYDICACCAPHLGSTGEIGQIKIIGMMKYKGGIRLTMVSGQRALLDHQNREKDMKAISGLLSAKEQELPEAVERLKEENDKLKNELLRFQRMLIGYKAERISADEKAVCLFEEELDGTGIRELMNRILDRGAKVCAVFLKKEQDSYQYVLGSRTSDVRSYGKALNETFSGRGGGKPEMIQGSLSGTEEEIRRFFEEITNE
nr:alanyl-tRNA editing protein [uncultured Sellimonas sp.]